MGCVSNVACKWLVQQQTLWFSLSLENKYRCNAVQFPEIRREAMIEGFPALVVKKFRLLCGLVPLFYWMHSVWNLAENVSLQNQIPVAVLYATTIEPESNFFYRKITQN